MTVNPKAWKEVEQFVQDCFARFGSMNKNNYEVALFHLLLRNGFDTCSDFELSVKLQIPESKVKRLRYEESLVYPKGGTDADLYYQEQLAILLLSRKYRMHNDRIQFAIADKHFRLYISDALMRDGRFADTSFNTNIVVISVADLLYLLEKANIKSAETMKAIRKSIEDGNKEEEKTVAGALQELTDEMLREMLRKVVSDKMIDKLEGFAKLLKEKIEKLNNKKQKKL